MTGVWKNDDNTWGRVAKAFHWVLALLILAQFVLGTVADEMRLSPQKIDLFVWHKSIGVTILLLVALRIAWRLVNRPPRPPAGIPAWETALAKLGHFLLYALMIAVPLSGWWISDTSRVPVKLFWLVRAPDILPPDRQATELAEAVHGGLTVALLVLIAIHVAAALRHHFILRNPILLRMLPGQHHTE